MRMKNQYRPGGRKPHLVVKNRKNSSHREDDKPGEGSGQAKADIERSGMVEETCTRPVAWPSRSPDLIPLDFLFWGHLKSPVYETPVATVEDFAEWIVVASANIESATKLSLGSSFRFQHDNDPKHTAEIVKLWLLYNVPNQLHTPLQSPDLNPIEHLWDLLECKIRQHNISSKDMLKSVLKDEWEKISAEETTKLVNSMLKRFQEVLERPAIKKLIILFKYFYSFY
ncbi:transposable element Tcb1 transposase [Trichonephila clavipes]|nr:transposable element Tcb1 transposase [Trichonephila clavipes]